MANDPANENGSRFNTMDSNLIANGGQSKTNPDKQNNKRKKGVQDLEDAELYDYIHKLYEKEQERSNKLEKELSEMRKQMSALTDLISELKDTIKRLNIENSQLHQENQSEKHKKSSEKNKKSKEKKKQIKSIKKQDENGESETDATNTNEKSPSKTTNVDVSETANENTNANGQTQNPKTERDTSGDVSIMSIEDDAEKREKEKTEDGDSNSGDDESETSENEYEDCNDEQNVFDANDKVKRTNKIPPIDVWTETQQSTQLLIRCKMPRYSCVFVKINKSKLRIIPKTADIRNKLLVLLDERKINYNTYTPSDEKMVNVLLKGTEISNDELIENALVRHGITPHRIQPYVTGYMRKNGINSNIWQVVLKPNTDTSEIFKIKYICEWSVKWEMMRKHTLTQCRRCQRFNHSSSNCRLPYRCVKCVNNHLPGMCELDNTQNKASPKCVNCNGKHTANNAALCPAFQREIEIREKRKQPKKTNTHTKAKQTVKSAVTTNASYADTVKATTSNQTNKKSQQPNETSDIMRMLQDSQQAMQQMIQSFLEGQNKIINALNNKR